MPETSDTADPGIDAVAVPKWINKVAWFLRITGVLILVASTLAIIQAGWPHSLRAAGSLMGLVSGTMLFMLSFLYVTTGRTRTVVSVVSIFLGVSVMVFLAARLRLLHL